MPQSNNVPQPLANRSIELKNTFSEHGNEIDEIISKRPHFIVRWGTSFMFLVIIFIVIVSWFIKYPDIISAKAKLSSINAPKTVVANTSGKLIKLFATEGEQTSQGTILGYLESNAKHEDIILLSKNIDSLIQDLNINNFQLLNYFNTSNESLGELQQSNQIFLQALVNFRNYISNGFYLRKKTMLAKDFAYQKKMHSNLLQQKGLNLEDVDLSQKTFNANQSLKNDKVISDFDYRNEQSKFINKKLTLPQINAAILSNEALQNEKQKEIMELENTIAQQKNIFMQALLTFKSQADEWKKKYLLIAPIDGKIAFATFLQENQQLLAGQTICYINPENSKYYAEVYIQQANFGKIKMGQDVLLKFPSYPFQEYGAVKGKIDFISNISTDSGYLAKVVLPKGLSTNYDKQVQYRDGLLAQGEIITQDLRLLQRFYYNLVKNVAK